MNKFLRIIIFFLFAFISNSFSQNVLQFSFTKVADGLSFPEGPAWNGEFLVVSNCYSNWITKINEENVDTFLVKPTSPFDFGKTNGLTFDKNGNLYACDYGEGKILLINKSGNTFIYANSFEGEKFNRPNDLAFDESGNLFFTDPKSYGKDKLDGRIFMIENKTKIVKKLWDSLAFPNGIAISKDGKDLFVCESAKNRVLKFKIENGGIANPSVFVELPGGDPDGIAFDINENLYVAHFGGQAIYVISKEGKVISKIPTPGKKPSNVEFGGKDMKTLFITEDETNSVYKTSVEIQGLRLFNSN